MKIFMNNKVYVSQKDIWFLLKSGLYEVPDGIIREVCPFGVISVDKTMENEFFVFESKYAKEYFRKLKCIINYSNYKNMSTDEISKIIVANLEDALVLSQKLKVVSDLETARTLYFNITNINYINESLYNLIDFKKGLLRINLPEKEKYDRDLKYKVFLKKMMEPIRYN